MKIRKSNIFLYLGIFGLLYPGFTISLWSYLYPEFLRYIVPILSLFLICLYSKRKSKERAPQYLICMWILMLLVMINNNYDISSGIYLYVLIYAILFLSTIFLVPGVEWFGKAFNIIKFFCLIHLILGLYFLVNKELLISTFVPIFSIGDNAKRILLQSIRNGYMTGITYHYSTMGMYMSLGTVAFSGFLFDTNKKKSKKEMVLFLVMLLGLFMTGKRGALLFTLIAIAWVYLLCCFPRTKKQFEKMFIGAIGSIVLFIIAYLCVPQVKSVIERFSTETGDLNEVSSGRLDYFWKNAIIMFNDSPLFGKGWRSFRREIVMVFGMDNANDAHNIYLQLLAETGIIGFIIMTGFFIASWRATYLAIRKNDGIKYIDSKYDMFLKVSLVYQTFFILYGFTGNPLYDLQCYVPYILCTAMGWSGFYFIKNKKKAIKLNYQR